MLITLPCATMIFAIDAVSAYTVHLPILIEGDAQFTPANGVTGGSGAPGDPYVIADWSINATTANGIEIRNTTAHFVIRGVYIYSDAIPSTGYGVVLRNLSDGSVEASTFEDYLTQRMMTAQTLCKVRLPP